MGSRFTFGEWLQAERVRRGWSQNELAIYAGIGRALVNKAESGNSEPAPKTLQALAKALGYPVELVYQKAGLLPQESEPDSLTRQGLNILRQLEGEDKIEALRQLRLRLQIAEERTENAGKKGKTRSAATERAG